MIKTSHILLVLILSTFSTIISSQVNDASIVIGLESNYLVATKTKTKLLLGSVKGLTIQKPLGQFSVGIGFLSKENKNSYSYGYATGNTKTVKDDVLYEYDKIDIKPDYYSFSTRLYYRLPCNCLFVFGGFEVDFLREGELISRYENYNYASIEYLSTENDVVFVREKVYNFNIGAGFNFPITQRLRFFGRPSVVFSQKIYPQATPTYRSRKEQPIFAHLSFGVEYGFGTYN